VIHAKHPDTPFAQIPFLPPLALLVGDQLTGVIDDSLVLVNGLNCENAKAVEFRTTTADLREDQFTGHKRRSTVGQLSVGSFPFKGIFPNRNIRTALAQSV
jgi:hypothetical protein